MILASKSSRRKELLEYITKDFRVEVSDVDETLNLDNEIVKEVEQLSYRKSLAVFKHNLDEVVIGADTVVVIENEILGKPKNFDEAFLMLKKLNNNMHEVITGVTIFSKKKSITFSCISQVFFKDISDEEIADYINECSPYDKAGSYGIQDKAALFIKGIVGDYYNVMGLPICLLNENLKKL
ncbi:MAG: Maf family protein [Erysipelotrichaceae bacterium]